MRYTGGAGISRRCERTLGGQVILTRGLYFPTPIWSAEIPEPEALNQELLAAIGALMDADPQGLQYSNLGGWQSRHDLHERPEFAPLFHVVRQVIGAVAQSYEVREDARLVIQNAWANVSPPGCANAPHIHAGSAFSGAYYVKTAPNCGRLEFLDPRGGADMARPLYPQNALHPLTQNRLSVEAAPGKMLVFPGWLQHHVWPNQSDQVRISVAFNLGFVAAERQSG